MASWLRSCVLVLLLADAGAAAANAESARFALFELHLKGGRVAQAQAVLERLDRTLAPDAAARANLAAAYEQLSQPGKAIAVWEAMARHGGQLSTEDKMKLAYLYELTVRPGEALAAWQSVWAADISSAQRSIVADRITTLGSQLGRLADLAVALEARHRAGTAGAHDASLLVRIYIKAGQKVSAVEAIEEYFAGNGADRVRILQEQGTVYRLLNDAVAYERTMRQLAALDPGRKPQYLRNLILARIENEDRDGHIAGLRDLLGELRQSEGSGSGAQLEAGVLAQAGFLDEAAAAYRRAIVLEPDTSDNDLLLGEVLKRQGHAEEAIARFQRMGEAAAADGLFLAAVDGLLNMEDARGADTQFRKVLLWAQRLCARRLMARGDEQYLYRTFADLAAAAGDPSHAFQALENFLPRAGRLRVALLRELITLATPSEDWKRWLDSSARGQIRGGARWRLAYGRRLIALREALPPEVYLRAGEDLVASADLAGAAHAFELADDMNADGQSASRIAGIYDRAGHEKEALNRYRLAHIAHAGDVSIAFELARLLERLGQREEAHALYLEAMKTVLSHQPVSAQGGSVAGSGASAERTTPEYGTYYPGLLRGLLATWPRAPAQAAATLAGCARLLDQELTLVGGMQGVEYEQHVRLDRLNRFFGAVALATGNVAALEPIDRRLTDTFPADEDLKRFLANRRQAWGYPAARSAQPPPSFQQVLEEAGRTRHFDPALELSLANADQSQMLEAARGWARSGAFAEAVQWADHGRLDERHFRSLCRYVAQLLREDSHIWEMLLAKGPEALERVESVTGAPLFSSRELMQRLRWDSEHPQWQGCLSYIVPRLSPDDRLALLRDIVSRPEAIWTALGLWRELLKDPLPAGFAAQASGLLGGMFDAQSAQFLRDSANAVTRQLLEPELDAGNIAVAGEVVAAWRRRTGTSGDAFRPLALLKSGDTQAALDALLDFTLGVAQVLVRGTDSADSVALPLQALQPLFIPRFSRQLQAHLQAMEAREGLNETLAETGILLFYSGIDPQPGQAIPFMEKAVERSPRNVMFLARLQGLYQNHGDYAKSLDMLERLHRIDPDNIIYRGFLYAGYLAAGRTDDAVRLNDESPEDMSNFTFFVSLVLRPEAERSGARLLLLPSSALPSPGGKNPVQRIAEAMANGQMDVVRTEMRGLAQRIPYMSIVDIELAEGHRKLLDAIAGYKFSIEEFEDALRSEPIENESGILPLYEFLAEAYARNDMAREKQAELADEVAAGRANRRQRALWRSLSDRFHRHIQPNPRASTANSAPARATYIPNAHNFAEAMDSLTESIFVSRRRISPFISVMSD